MDEANDTIREMEESVSSFTETDLINEYHSTATGYALRMVFYHCSKWWVHYIHVNYPEKLWGRTKNPVVEEKLRTLQGLIPQRD